MLTTCQAAKKEDISRYASEHGISELNVPKTILHIEKMPVLGSGKKQLFRCYNLCDGTHKLKMTLFKMFGISNMLRIIDDNLDG